MHPDTEMKKRFEESHQDCISGAAMKAKVEAQEEKAQQDISRLKEQHQKELEEAAKASSSEIQRLKNLLAASEAQECGAEGKGCRLGVGTV